MEHEVEEGQWGADQGMDVRSRRILGTSYHHVEHYTQDFGCVHAGSQADDAVQDSGQSDATDDSSGP